MSQGQGGGRPSKAVDLAKISVPRLVFALLHQRFTGTVAVHPAADAAPRTAWLSGGMPVFSDWPEPTDMLGQILIEDGLLDDGELYAALAQAAEQKRRLGQVLLDRRSITPVQLTEALRRQCAKKLTHLFALREGIAHVTAEAHALGEGDGLVRLNVLELIAAAVGLHYDEERVASEMGASVDGPMRATAALRKYQSHFRFRPSDRDALDALVNGTDLRKLGAMPGVTNRRAAQLVYTLWACQMLHVGAAALEASGPVPAARSRATPTHLGGTAPIVAEESIPAPPQRPRRATQPELGSAGTDPGASSSSLRPETGAVQSRSSTGTRPESSAAAEGAAVGFDDELARYEAMLESSAHAFALFDLPLDAEKRDVRRAWGDLSRKFHPDALAARGLAHLRERVSTVFAALSEAHRILGDPSERAALRERIEKGEHGKPATDETARVRAAFEAELLAKEGDKFLRANRFDRALENYLQAEKLSPEEPDVLAAIVWCRFQLSEKSPDDHTRAGNELSEIIGLSPNTARASYFRGFVLAGLGQDALAVDAFARAYELDQRLIDAERQARAIRMRRSSAAQAAAKPRTGLRGLFGKK